MNVNNEEIAIYNCESEVLDRLIMMGNFEAKPFFELLGLFHRFSALNESTSG